MGNERPALESTTATPTAERRRTSAAKLFVGAVDDAAEHEADVVAAHFDQASGGLRIQRSFGPPSDPGEPDSDQSVGAEGGPLAPHLEQSIESSRSGGRPLPEGPRGRLESFFGADLSGVRLHDDARASRISRSINATAFTTGNDIFLGSDAPRPGTPDGDHLLAHEVTHVVQQGSAIARSVGVRRTPNRIRRAGYANLSPTNQKQVDAKAESDYYDHAGRFEIALGKRIAATSEAEDIVEEMILKVKGLVDAWAKQVGWDLDKTYVDTFGRMSAKDTGSIPPIAEDIKAVFKGGSLRERLTLIYSAIRSDNLQMLLNVAYQDITTTGTNVAFKWKTDTGVVDINQPKGFAKKSGLDKHLQKNTAVTADIKGRVDTTQPVNARSNLFGRGDMITELEQSGEKQFVGEANTDKAIATHQTLEESDLSERELRNQVNALKGGAPMTKGEAALAAKAAKMKPMAWLEAEYKRLQALAQPGTAAPDATPTQWVSGENWYRSQVDSKVAEEASNVKAKLRASISGTTDMYLHAAQYLGMASPKELAKVRLAMLAWMLPARDHSFYEIMKSATQYGLNDYDPAALAWTHYEAPIAPLKKTINTGAAKDTEPPAGAPKGKFPGYFLSPPGYNDGTKDPAYKDLLATKWLGTSGVIVRSDQEMGWLLAAGAPKNLINHMAQPEWDAARDLLAKVAKATWTGDDVAKTQTFTNLTALPSYVALGTSAATLLAAFVNKLVPGFTLPDSHKPFLAHAKMLTPMEKGERFTPDELAAHDPATDKALINPEYGTKGSGKKSTDNAYAANKAKFIDDVLKYDPDKFRADPAQMNGWFETYGRKLNDTYPDANLDQLRALNSAREKAKGTPQEAAVEKAFDDAYQKVFQLEELTEAEKVALNLYTVSAVANSVNAAARGDKAALEKSGETAQLMISALEKLKPWSGGPVYRGDANRGFKIGAVINYNEFVSTAKTVKSSFINKSAMGWATHAIVIEHHHSGKDVMALSGYTAKTFEKMEAEILFPPGVSFVVTRIEDWTHLKSPLEDIDREIQQVTVDIGTKTKAGEDVSALVARKKQLQTQRTHIPTQKELVNKVWVYLDEV